MTKHRNPEDDRTVTVVLTDSGRELREAMLEIPRQMAQTFSGHEALLVSLKAQLDQTLRMMEENR